MAWGGMGRYEMKNLGIFQPGKREVDSKWKKLSKNRVKIEAKE